MAGVKRPVDAKEDRNGKRSKQASAPSKKFKAVEPVKKSKSKDSKSGKSDKKSSKKVQKDESSEDEDEFDIDNISSDDDLDEVDEAPEEDVDMEDVSDEKEVGEDDDEEMENDKPEGHRSMFSLTWQCNTWSRKSNRYLFFRPQCECVSRVSHQAKGSPTGAQERQAQCRYDCPFQEALGAAAPQVPRPTGAEKEAHQGAVRDHHRPRSRLCLQARLRACYSDRFEIRKLGAAQGNRRGIEGKLQGVGPEPLRQVLGWKINCPR